MDLARKNNISVISRYFEHVGFCTRLMNRNYLWKSVGDPIVILLFFLSLCLKVLSKSVVVECQWVYQQPMGVSVGVAMGVSVGVAIGMSVGVVATVTWG